MPYHIHIPANTPEELKAALEEAAHILTGLSEAVNAFDEHFGHEMADKKRRWKKKADDWRKKYKIIS